MHGVVETRTGKSTETCGSSTLFIVRISEPVGGHDLVRPSNTGAEARGVSVALGRAYSSGHMA